MTSGQDEKGLEEIDGSEQEERDAVPASEDAVPPEAAGAAPEVGAAPETDAQNGGQEAASTGEFAVEDGIHLLEFDPVEELEQDLRETTARLKTVSAAYQKLQGEFNHFKGRTERQLELRQTILKGDVVKGLFEPLENLRRSIDAMKRGEAAQAWIDGMEAVNKNFMDAFRALGLEEVQPHEGDVLDTHWHEGMGLMPVTDEQLDGRVVGVFERGYRIGQRCIRPAKVLVGSYTPPEPEPEPESEAPAEGEGQVGEA